MRRGVSTPEASLLCIKRRCYPEVLSIDAHNITLEIMLHSLQGLALDLVEV